MVIGLLEKDVPATSIDQQDFFDPYYSGVSERDKNWLRQNGDNLRKTLVYKNGVMPLGLLAFCLAYPQNKAQSGGVFACVRKRFAPLNGTQLAARLNEIKDFRNMYITHQERELTNAAKAKAELMRWIGGLQEVYHAHHG